MNFCYAWFVSVDWGSLAKQWITQRETILPETFNQPPPPPPPPPPESYGIDSSAGIPLYYFK